MILRSPLLLSGVVRCCCVSCPCFVIGLFAQTACAAEPKIEITSATYGILEGGPNADVKELIVRRIKDGKVRIEIANDCSGTPLQTRARS